ncbi:hypothetical protein PRK78_002669 [Emydomyces testavorans]|uniref:Gag1-like clamp domain-containing protein n=1 Tax=Emydomyces testavorans TaxID=2070801 RepID=A0AAF0IHT6_9EURO|nr:hypothetical protein PRK78_002669 [Emydomyces testavorans]
MDRPRHSPESSSHPHHPTLFASLHRRTRTTESTTSETSKEARERASREAKRYILQVVRNDWSYDPATASSAPPCSSTSAEGELSSQGPKGRDVLEWRLREEDSSNSDREESRSAGENGTDPYRFECPDAIQDTLRERRRKRRKLIEDEMEWNPGLRIWTHRRDAWTGARVPYKQKTEMMDDVSKPRTSCDGSAGGSSSNDTDELETAGTVSRSTSAGSAPSITTTTEASSTHFSPTPPPLDHTTSRSTITVPQPAEPPSSSDEPLVPVAPPLLPDSNPFRAYTSPANYPAIYNKLVVEGNTPAVPVNLLHMTRALVQGWTKEGQWPPRPTLTRDVPVLKKKRPQALAESSIRPTTTTTTTTPTTMTAPLVEESLNRRRSIGSNVTGAVKKVFGFASMHPGHRFHIRGHSQGNLSPPPTEHAADGGKLGN